MWIMTVLKVSLSSYKLLNTKILMSVVCIERRIPAAANFNDSKFNLLFILGNLTSKMVYICGDYNIDILLCEEVAETKYFLDQMFKDKR